MFVPCKDAAEMKALLDSGLLWLNTDVSPERDTPTYVPASTWWNPGDIEEEYEHACTTDDWLGEGGWRPQEFGYVVED